MASFVHQCFKMNWCIRTVAPLGCWSDTLCTETMHTVSLHSYSASGEILVYVSEHWWQWGGGLGGPGNWYLCFRLGAHALCWSGEVTPQREGRWGEETGEELGKGLISTLRMNFSQILTYSSREGLTEVAVASRLRSLFVRESTETRSETGCWRSPASPPPL